MDTMHEIHIALSPERFARYLAWRDGDAPAALALYALNSRLSEALYIPLQTLEITLRNRIHAVMSDCYGAHWILNEDIVKIKAQRAQLASAVDELKGTKKSFEPHDIIAKLSFGFWTGMLNKNPYENLWQERLHRIAKKKNGKGLRRTDLSDPLDDIRRLRNRIAHHEPIVHWNLPKHYNNILMITGYLHPTAERWTRELSRFAEICPAEPIVTDGA